MSLVLFDDARGGHHGVFLSGVARALTSRGVGVTVVSPEPPEVEIPRRLLSWEFTPAVGLRDHRQTRQELRRIARSLSAATGGTVWDFYADKNLLAIPGTLLKVADRVHILHRSVRFSYQQRKGLAKVRTAILRHQLRRLAYANGRIVVHTARAAEVVGRFIPTSSFLLLPDPVCHEDDLAPESHRVTEGPPRLLFVGTARPEKGLSTLLDALQILDEAVTLTVVGPQDPELTVLVDERYPGISVSWDNRFVERERIKEAYREASLVVVPYTRSFELSGAASGVLLEAIAHAVPVLTTTALLPQLPPAYPGAHVVPSEDAMALAEGLSGALGRLDSLRRGAAEHGPGFIRGRHTFEHYVTRLLLLPKNTPRG